MIAPKPISRPHLLLAQLLLRLLERLLAALARLTDKTRARTSPDPNWHRDAEA